LHQIINKRNTQKLAGELSLGFELKDEAKKKNAIKVAKVRESAISPYFTIFSLPTNGFRAFWIDRVVIQFAHCACYIVAGVPCFAGAGW
jgi:hypothetical protein